MHISDLHINSNNHEKIIEQIQDLSFSFTPDLLLITGDIVQGSYSAMTFWDNYSKAIKVLRALAAKLWSYEIRDSLGSRSFIRSDWKKRIVISSGNHDYASMNDLVAENKKRKTLSGKPVSIPSNTLVRHSYFIVFLYELLGTEIDELVKNDINELINYDMLNLTVLNINTNSRVNPYRTNKVKINTEAVTKIYRAAKEQNYLICMMHHTPIYDINYTNDVYYLKSEIRDTNIRNKLDSNPLTKNKAVRDIWLELINSMQKDFIGGCFGLNPKEQEEILEQILLWLKINEPKFYIENGLDDFLYFLRTEQDERKSDDRCNHLIFALKEQHESSQADIKSYVAFVKEFFKTIKHNFVILGGHNHQPREFTGSLSGVFENCSGIYEASKFYDNGSGFNYVLLDFNSSKPNPEVVFFPSKKDIKKCDGSMIINDILEKPFEES